MQQDPNQPGAGNPTNQAAYKAAMLQAQQAQQQQAMRAAQQQQQQQQLQLQLQQQQQQQQQQGAPGSSTQAQQAHQATLGLQALLMNNPEGLAAFVAAAREGKVSAEQLQQLRALLAQQNRLQQNSGQPGAAPQQAPQQQQPPQAQQQPPPPQQRPPPAPAAQQQQAPQQGPPMSAAEQQIMEQAQRLAAPLAAKIQQLDALLRRQPGEGGPAGEERVRIEQALAEAKANQVQFGRQFLAAREHAARQAAQAHAAAQAQQQQQAQAQNPQQRALQAQAHGDGSSAAGGSGVNSPALGSQGRSPAPGPGGAGSTPARTGSPAVVPSSGTASGAGGAAPSPLGQARPLAAKDGAQAASRQGSIPNQQAVPSPGPGQAQAQHRPSPGVGQAMATVPSLHTTPSIPATLSVQPAVPESYPNSSGPRPTLSQGLGTTPLLGTPAVLRRPDPLPRGSATPGSTTPGGSALGGVTNWEELLGMAAREGSRMNVNDDFGLGGGATAGTGVASGSGTAQGTGATPGFPSSAADDRLLTKRKVQELVGEIDANERLEGDVEDLLLEIADEFIDSVTQFACRLAKHRKGDKLEVRDVQLHLERNWNIRVPFPGSMPIPPPRTRPRETGGTKGVGG